MADTLLIHFNPVNPELATWALVNTAGELSNMLSHGSLSDAAVIAEKHKSIVLLESTDIYIDSVNLPIKNPQKLLRAIPFSLEEKIADDIDDLHFVAAKTSADGSTAVAAIKHETLKRILSSLETANINPIAIIPDSLCLTANANQWAMLLQDDRCSLQFNSLSAGKFDRDALALLLKMELQQVEPQPEKIIVFQQDGDKSEISDIQEIIPQDIELIKVSYNSHPLVVFCGQYKHALALNLLQHSYQPQQKVNVNWQRWRLAASLSFIWLCLNLGMASVQNNEYAAINKELQTGIDRIYKKAFPQSKRIVNARVQMEQKLDELKGGGQASSGTSFVTLLAASSVALSSDKSLTIESINYRNNTIDVAVTGKNLQSIEQLNKKLNNAALYAEIISSSSDKNQVKGSIRIKTKSAS